jgi:outer membrane murein-binding lipoprotein Lpp
MSACEIARTMSLFEIDEALDLLIEAAAEQVSGPEGDISEELRTALARYVDAFGEKVDRIANYIKAQEAFAEAAKKEANRLEARRRSAENRVKTCKGFLCWFMICRSLKHLKGTLNTVTLSENSAETLMIDEAQAVPQAFMSVLVSLPWPRWEELLSHVPEGTLLRELRRQALETRDLDRGRVSEALKAGHVVPGARLSRGKHVRLR